MMSTERSRAKAAVMMSTLDNDHQCYGGYYEGAAATTSYYGTEHHHDGDRPHVTITIKSLLEMAVHLKIR